jgi:hypothetical protein
MAVEKKQNAAQSLSDVLLEIAQSHHANEIENQAVFERLLAWSKQNDEWLKKARRRTKIDDLSASAFFFSYFLKPAIACQRGDGWIERIIFLASKAFGDEKDGWAAMNFIARPSRQIEESKQETLFYHGVELDLERLTDAAKRLYL